MGSGALALSVGDALAAAKRGSEAAPRFDILPYVHPELRAMVPVIEQMGSGSVNAATLPAMRRAAQTKSAPSIEHGQMRMIPGPPNAPDVRIYILNTGTTRGARPAIVHMHGGGFVAGTAADGIATLQEIAGQLDCVIVTVDYRLAPETRFPGALEDNYAALRWLHGHAAELGVDPTRIAVMGESAGGGHAAMLAIAARDRGEVPVVYQALTYPMLDDRTGSTRMPPAYQGALIWNAASNRFGWSSLLGVPAGSAHVPFGSVPARLDNFKGLAPAFVGVGSIDLFVNEDIEYARRLIDAGIGVDLHVVPGGFHGFDTMPTATIGKAYRAALLSGLRLAFTPATGS